LSTLDRHVTVVRAELRHDLGADALVLHLLEQLHPDPRVADLGELRDRFRLLRSQDWADADFLGQGVRVERRLREDAYHVERRRPRDLDGIDDLVPDSLDDRGHRHHGGDPDHHAQDRERRAELVGAQLVEGDEPALGYGMELHGTESQTVGSGEWYPTVLRGCTVRTVTNHSPLPTPLFTRTSTPPPDPGARPAWLDKRRLPRAPARPTHSRRPARSR